MAKFWMVYLTENLINFKKYIGMHHGQEDDGYLGSGAILAKAIKKHGRNNFQRVILGRYPSRSEASDAERAWIEKFDARKRRDFYNVTDGGYGGDTVSFLNEGQQSERSEKIKEYFRNLPADEKEKIAKRRSENMKTIRANSEIEKKRLESLRNTLKSKEPDDIVKTYDNRRGENNPNSKSVVTPLGIFINLSAAAKQYGITVTTVTNRCNNSNFPEWYLAQY